MAKNNTQSETMGKAHESTVSERALATIDKPKEMITLVNGRKLVLARKVTRNQLKVVDDNPLYIKFVTKISDPEKDANGVVKKSNNMDAPYTAVVIDLTDEVEKDMIMNAVLKTALEKSYPDQGYVGKMFTLCKQKKADGKRYSLFDVAEIFYDDAGDLDGEVIQRAAE